MLTIININRFRLNIINIMVSNQTITALETLGLLIKTAREQARLSQIELATRLGTSRQTVAAIEKGKPKVAIATVFEAAVIVGVPLLSTEQGDISKWKTVLQHFDAILPTNIPNKKVKLDDNF